MFATICKLKSYLNLTKLKSTFTQQSTIFAVSSGQGKCGVAVIRISGAQASSVLKQLTGMKTLPKPRYAYLKNITSTTGDVLDKGLILWFPGPASFTGEDTCELQVHGGYAVVNSILKTLSSLQNLRLAEPGEFTRRAFYNGKLDLTEVEGLADLLAAETEVQRKQAFLQTQGSLSKLYKRWKDVLIKSLANLEAHIDFDESEGLDSGIFEQTVQKLNDLTKEITRHLNDNRKGEILRSGVKTVIIGEPNVGKSSLFNSLCLKPAAIVTPFEGTTRDILEKVLDIGGYPLLLMDTAGLRTQTNDVIEKEGIKRALGAIQDAHLILLVFDCSNYLQWLKMNPSSSPEAFIRDYLKRLSANLSVKEENGTLSFSKPTIVIANKADLIDKDDLEQFNKFKVILVSCKSDYCMPSLVEHLKEKLKLLCGNPSEEHPSVSQMRHREHLIACVKNLQDFLSSCEDDRDIVLVVEHLRKALFNLGKITGQVSTEQLLDVVFREFCIGK